MSLSRSDFQVICDWIEPNSRVLDLGCGNGELLPELSKNQGVSGYGIEIDDKNVSQCIKAGVNVIQRDLDLGLSDSNGEPVSSILTRTLPVSIALVLPGFVLGNLLGLALGLLAAWYRGKWLDKLVMSASVVGMSVSFLVIIIGLQILLCTPYGLNLFPVRGWQVNDLVSYLYYVTVPTLAIVLVTLGYNTRFYRAVMADEIERDHINTLRAFGAAPYELLLKHVLKNSLIPILTRIMFSVPFVVISGSLLLESYFGIPGIGLVTFNAITSGDQPVLKAVVSLTGVLFVLALMFNDMLYSIVDPRVSKP